MTPTWRIVLKTDKLLRGLYGNSDQSVLLPSNKQFMII